MAKVSNVLHFEASIYPFKVSKIHLLILYLLGCFMFSHSKPIPLLDAVRMHRPKNREFFGNNKFFGSVRGYTHHKFMLRCISNEH